MSIISIQWQQPLEPIATDRAAYLVVAEQRCNSIVQEAVQIVVAKVHEAELAECGQARWQSAD
eukprot:747937-Prymnesium_polylepis.3